MAKGVNVTIQLYTFDTPNGCKINMALEEMWVFRETKWACLTMCGWWTSPGQRTVQSV